MTTDGIRRPRRNAVFMQVSQPSWPANRLV
jgi:hypothetical protein